MSLINEALKKAQRQRHGEPAAAGGQADTGGSVTKRAQPKSATSMLFIVAAGLVLVALSIVATTLWLTRPSTPVVASAKPAVATPKAEPAKAPVVVVPAINPPAPTSTSATAATTTPAAVTSAKALTASKPASPETATPPTVTATPPPAATVAPTAETKAPAAAVTVPPKPVEPAAPPKPDERINKFVEALRVTGIRSSGTESKVLMNDRVYRVNDIVDRALGVRLTKVSPDSLTFTDANGAPYVKFF